MKMNRLLLLIGTLGGAVVAFPARAADLRPMRVDDVSGTLRIQQEVPCDDIDRTTPVSGGHIEITPAGGLDAGSGARTFVLSRASITFTPFTISKSCLTIDRTRAYTEVGVQLERAVSFTASPSSPGVFPVSIPRDEVTLYEAAVVNGDLETGYKRPAEDVTGTIDLVHGTLDLRVVLATHIHFSVGPIDEDGDGTLTADLTGTLTFVDSDSDGVPDNADNCPLTANPTQAPVATPVVTAPPDLTLASCADHAIGVAGATDICDGTAVTVTNNAPATFARGLNVVTWRGQDGKGRVGTAAQRVTVVDTTPPVFTSVPGPLALNNCGPAALGLPTATDDCAGTPSFSNNAPASFPVGPTVVTWTAADVAGNHATATQTVTVTDTVPPAVTCASVHPGKHGDDGVGVFFRVSAQDACAPPPTIKLGSFTIANGETIQITPTHRPGVKLVGTEGKKNVRHFKVGFGENVVRATDGSANVASAVCPLAADH
jgi:hypothetical protein